MRRIKLVVSDFHLGTGRIAADGAINDVEDFISDRAFAELLEYYRTGEYVDADAELILNGDIFECLGQIDDEDEDATMITAAKSLAKIDRIIDGHPEVFEALAVFAESEHRQVTFLVGNHDQDLVWEEVRARLRERIHPQIRVLDDVYRFDGIHLEHGNAHESQNYVNPRQLFLTKGLAEPVLNLPWGSDLFITSLMRMKRRRPYVNRVRPFRLAFFWSLFHDFRTVMRGIWYLLSAIVKARFRKHRQRRITFLTTLRVLLSLSAYPTLERAAARVLRANGSLHTVIFGHTHIPMARQIEPGRRYLNSGSWIPNSNLHIAALGRSLQQTYIFIDYEQERARCRLKQWYGRRVIEEDVIL